MKKQKLEMIMKKPNRFCIVITTIILLFLVSCVDRTGKYIFYQFKNETGEDLKLKFYYTHKSIAPAYDSPDFDIFLIHIL